MLTLRVTWKHVESTPVTQTDNAPAKTRTGDEKINLLKDLSLRLAMHIYAIRSECNVARTYCDTTFLRRTICQISDTRSSRI